MTYKVYILQSEKDGHLYIGMTADLQRRLYEHNSGQTRSTASRRPFRLIHEEEVENRVAARLLEKKYKSGSGREFIRQSIIPR